MSQIEYAATHRRPAPDHPEPMELEPPPPPDAPNGDDPTVDEEGNPPPWKWGKRLLFRFAFVYFILYALPDLLAWIPTKLIELIPGSEKAVEWIGLISGAPDQYVWYKLTPWLGEHVLQVGYEFRAGPNGSGDTTHDYIKLLVIFIAALLGAAIWSLIDRRRRFYRILPRLLWIATRYYLGFYMILYGFFKIIKLQFPDPGPFYLTATYGDSSPMRLLWFFMGYSEPYTFFAGLGEVLGGALLLWRRTTTLGALVTMGVMANVVMMNFAYDIPVKLFSSHLLLMAAMLAALDVRRLTNVFLLNRTAIPNVTLPLIGSRPVNVALQAVKYVLIGSLMYGMISDRMENVAQRDEAVANTPHYGIWEVETFSIDGAERPPLLTDTERWRQLLIQSPGSARVRLMNNQLVNYRITFDTDAKTAEIVSTADPDTKATWTVEEPDEDALVLSGDLDGRPYRIQFRRKNIGEYNLMCRGFHWINEFPNNNEQAVVETP